MCEGTPRSRFVVMGKVLCMLTFRSIRLSAQARDCRFL